jgi:hypothetical protein
MASVLREGGAPGMVAKAMKGVKGDKGTKAEKGSKWQKSFGRMK